MEALTTERDLLEQARQYEENRTISSMDSYRENNKILIAFIDSRYSQ
jgi:hypothetical protein